MPTQRAIPPESVNEYQQKVGSKRAYHTMHRPRIRNLAASAGVQLRATGNRDQCRLMGLKAQERTLHVFTFPAVVNHSTVSKAELACDHLSEKN